MQQWIGQMEIGIDAARAQLFETARLWRDHPELQGELAPQIAAAKYLCTNAACAASEIGLRVAGGFSLTPELSLERHFRDSARRACSNRRRTTSPWRWSDGTPWPRLARSSCAARHREISFKRGEQAA